MIIKKQGMFDIENLLEKQKHNNFNIFICMKDDWMFISEMSPWTESGLILGLRPANERRCYLVTTSLIGWAQT